MKAATQVLPMTLSVSRLRVMLLLLLGAFGVLIGRAVYLQGLNHDFLQQKGESRYSRVIELSPTRGMIVDRNREPLAISTPVESVWASPSDAKITPPQMLRLAQLLELDSAEMGKRFADTRREFVYLKRHLPPEQAAKVIGLDLPGVFLQREYRRYYPAGEYTAHLIGFTDIDDKGQPSPGHPRRDRAFPLPTSAALMCSACNSHPDCRFFATLTLRCNSLIVKSKVNDLLS